MGKFSPYSVALASLPEGKHERDFVCDKAFFEAMDCPDVLDADVRAHLVINHKNEAYDCEIAMTGEISIPCDRCLDPLRHEIDDDFRIMIKYGDDYDDSREDLLIIPYEERNFDFSRLLCDTVLLSIPLRRVHKPGECNADMEARLHDHGGDSADEEPSDEEE